MAAHVGKLLLKFRGQGSVDCKGGFITMKFDCEGGMITKNMMTGCWPRIGWQLLFLD